MLDIADSPAAGFALVTGIVLAVWSASGYAGAFSRAMNRIYDIEEGRPFWKLKPTQLAVTVIAIALLVVAGDHPHRLRPGRHGGRRRAGPRRGRTDGMGHRQMAGLLWLWIANLALLFGAEFDAELERGRQLQAGIAAEKDIQLPPRDTRKSEKAAQQERDDIDAGREIRTRTTVEGPRDTE